MLILAETLVRVLAFGFISMVIPLLIIVRAWIGRQGNGLGLGVILTDLMLSLIVVVNISVASSLIQLLILEDPSHRYAQVPIYILLGIWGIISIARLSMWWIAIRYLDPPGDPLPPQESTEMI